MGESIGNDDLEEEIVIGFNVGSFITPQYFMAWNNTCRKTHGIATLDKLAKVHWMGCGLRTIPYGVLLDIVEGTRKMVIEGNALKISKRMNETLEGL
jgi:hypothetical protein